MKKSNRSKKYSDVFYSWKYVETSYLWNKTFVKNFRNFHHSNFFIFSPIFSRIVQHCLINKKTYTYIYTFIPSIIHTYIHTYRYIQTNKQTNKQTYIHTYVHTSCFFLYATLMDNSWKNRKKSKNYSHVFYCWKYVETSYLWIKTSAKSFRNFHHRKYFYFFPDIFMNCPSKSH